jgi:GAF domain-containing protein
MAHETRERRLTTTFVTLADTLVTGYDVVDLLQTLVDTCADVLDASAAGLMLADEGGELAVVASTSEQSRLVEMMQLGSGSGPCVECFETGLPVSVPDVDLIGDRWPGFRDEAVEQGFRSVHAVALRLRGSVIGTLNLFHAEVGQLSHEDMAVAQGLADVATIGILQERAISEADLTKRQLQHALDSRVLIEQAKGVLTQTHRLDMSGAFRLLRDQARSMQSPLTTVATGVIDGSLRLPRA